MILLDWLSRGGVKVEIKNEPCQEVSSLRETAKQIQSRKQGLGGYKQKTWGEIVSEKKAEQFCQEAGHPLTLSGYCLIEDCPYMSVQLKSNPEYFMNQLPRDELADYTIKLLAWQKPVLEKKNRKVTGAQKAAILRKLSKDNEMIATFYEEGWESVELNNAVVEQLCEAGHWALAKVFDDSLSLSEDEMVDLVRNGNADYNKEVKEWEERTKALKKQNDDLSCYKAEYL